MACDLTKTDRLQLEYLARSNRPLWWGHLERGEALPEGSDLKRWRDAGLIEPVGTKGYVLTEKGHAVIATRRDHQRH